MPTTERATPRPQFEICPRRRPLLDQRIEWAAERGWTLRLRPQDCAAIARAEAHWLRRGLSRHALNRIRRAVESTGPLGRGCGARLSLDEVRAIQALEEAHAVRS